MKYTKTKKIAGHKALDFLYKIGRAGFIQASWETSGKTDKVKKGTWITEDALGNWFGTPEHGGAYQHNRTDQITQLEWLRANIPSDERMITFTYLPKRK